MGCIYLSSKSQDNQERNHRNHLRKTLEITLCKQIMKAIGRSEHSQGSELFIYRFQYLFLICLNEHEVERKCLICASKIIKYKVWYRLFQLNLPLKIWDELDTVCSFYYLPYCPFWNKKPHSKLIDTSFGTVRDKGDWLLHLFIFTENSNFSFLH